MPGIFEFLDYRLYLQHYYRERKAETRFFSYRYFARKAGINSSSFLKHVMEGSRNLTPAARDKFCAALGLAGKEATYFRHLVAFNQARTAAEKQEHYAVLRSLAGNVKETVLKASQYAYFAHWYMPAVRELACLGDFGRDFRALGRALRPPIGPVAARQAVALLLKLGLLRRDPDGRYRQTSAAITADDEVATLAQREYVAAMLHRSAEAVQAFGRRERHTSTLTLGVSPATYAALASEIEAFKDRVKAMVARDRAASRVYQLSLALVPVSAELATPADGEGGGT